jgi:hypothetical protein
VGRIERDRDNFKGALISTKAKESNFSVKLFLKKPLLLAQILPVSFLVENRRVYLP